MSDKSAIEWTNATWNPIRGCSRVSEGCRHCYAERVAARFSGPGQPYEGLIKLGKWNGQVKVVNEHLADPLRWKRPRRIFVNSMSDLFHESLTNEEIAAVFGVMAAAPRHTFQVLTKRAKRMREWFEWVGSPPQITGMMHGRRGVLGECLAGIDQPLADRAWAAMVKERTDREGQPTSIGDACAWPWPLPNVWLGVSVENQAAADERIPELLRTRAAVRFLSVEPMLGPINLNAKCPPFYAPHMRSDRISWVIAGCESGPGARPCDVAWLRSLRDQCAAADGVAFFLKQAVETPDDGNHEDPRVVGYPDGPRPLTPVVCGPGSHRKAGGIIGAPYLDGVQHLAFPAVAS